MYNFNLKRFISLLLPIILRKNIIDFLAVLLNGVKNIHLQFLVFRSQRLTDLSYNSQVFSLEKLLNDLYDNSLRRIKIYDGNYAEPIISYPQADEIALVTTFVVFPAINYIYSGFVVQLPASFNPYLYGNMDRINKIEKKVNTYKFVGTKHKIIYL